MKDSELEEKPPSALLWEGPVGVLWLVHLIPIALFIVVLWYKTVLNICSMIAIEYPSLSVGHEPCHKATCLSSDVLLAL